MFFDGLMSNFNSLEIISNIAAKILLVLVLVLEIRKMRGRERGRGGEGEGTSRGIFSLPSKYPHSRSGKTIAHFTQTQPDYALDSPGPAGHAGAWTQTPLSLEFNPWVFKNGWRASASAGVCWQL
jgi:hypothetical protein